MAKKKQSRQKKMNTRVDFTPMVDMMMLLITFFMLCTSLAKPQTMNLTLPTNDDVPKEEQNVTPESRTITVYACGNNKIYYIEGMPKYDDPSCLKETTWGKDGIRSVIIKHKTDEGIAPVGEIMAAKERLDQKKLANPDQYPDSIYDKKLSEIKKGNLENGKVAPLTLIIKCTDEASYKNMVDALDEMTICSIGTYVIDKVSDDDKQLLNKRGIK